MASITSIAKQLGKEAGGAVSGMEAAGGRLGSNAEKAAGDLNTARKFVKSEGNKLVGKVASAVSAPTTFSQHPGHGSAGQTAEQFNPTGNTDQATSV